MHVASQTNRFINDDVPLQGRGTYVIVSAPWMLRCAQVGLFTLSVSSDERECVTLVCAVDAI